MHVNLYIGMELLSCVTLFLASVWVGVLTICVLMLLGTVGNPDGSTATVLFLKQTLNESETQTVLMRRHRLEQNEILAYCTKEYTYILCEYLICETVCNHLKQWYATLLLTSLQCVFNYCSKLLLILLLVHLSHC